MRNHDDCALVWLIFLMDFHIFCTSTDSIIFLPFTHTGGSDNRKKSLKEEFHSLMSLSHFSITKCFITCQIVTEEQAGEEQQSLCSSALQGLLPVFPASSFVSLSHSNVTPLLCSSLLSQPPPTHTLYFSMAIVISLYSLLSPSLSLLLSLALLAPPLPLSRTLLRC